MSGVGASVPLVIYYADNSTGAITSVQPKQTLETVRKVAVSKIEEHINSNWDTEISTHSDPSAVLLFSKEAGSGQFCNNGALVQDICKPSDSLFALVPAPTVHDLPAHMAALTPFALERPLRNTNSSVLNTLMERLDQMENDSKAALKAAEKESKASISDLTRKVELSKEESKAAKEESKAAKEEAKAAKEEAKSAKEESKAAKEEAKSAKEESKAAKEESKAAKEESKAALKAAEKEFKVALKAAEKDSKASISELTRKGELSEEDAKAARKQLSETVTKVKRQQEEMAGMQQHINELEADHNDVVGWLTQNDSTCMDRIRLRHLLDIVQMKLASLAGLSEHTSAAWRKYLRMFKSSPDKIKEARRLLLCLSDLTTDTKKLMTDEALAVVIEQPSTIRIRGDAAAHPSRWSRKTFEGAVNRNTSRTFGAGLALMLSLVGTFSSV